MIYFDDIDPLGALSLSDTSPGIFMVIPSYLVYSS